MTTKEYAYEQGLYCNQITHIPYIEDRTNGLSCDITFLLLIIAALISLIGLAFSFSGLIN